LNQERRLRELKSITYQNQQIYHRIQNSRPTYNHTTWKEQAKVNEKILSNICEFKPSTHATCEKKTRKTVAGVSKHTLTNDILDDDMEF